MTLDKMAPWELEKLLTALAVVRDLCEERIYAQPGELEYTDKEMACYEDALLALKLLELEVRVARAKE